MKPLVTVITPTYNHEKFIAQCIKSVLSQTFKRWKMIIVDDNSSDSTFKIATKYAKKDKRIKLIKHKKTWGISKLSRTYNQALKLCKTKYIAILEGDDFWPEDKLEKQLNNICRKNAIFSFGNSVFVSRNGWPINLYRYTFPKNLMNNRPIGSVLALFANLRFSIIPVTILIRRKELVKIGGFCNDRFYPFPDIPTLLKLALVGKFSYQDEVLGFYRRHSGSEWYNFACSTDAMGREEVQKCVNAFLKKNIKNSIVEKIFEDTGLAIEQERFIKRKSKNKKISLLLNDLAFNFKINPLTVVFLIQYFLFWFRKVVHKKYV